MDTAILDGFIVAVLAIIAVASQLATAFGPYQESITEAVIEGFGIPKRFKRLTNFGVGLTLGLLFAVVIAFYMGAPIFIPIGVLIGVLASVSAAKAHDSQKVA